MPQQVPENNPRGLLPMHPSNPLDQPSPLTPTNTPVYVTWVDPDVYEGNHLQEGDYFTSTEKASAFIGCARDEIAAEFCYTQARGWGWGCAVVRGVTFTSPVLLNRSPYHRAPLVDPLPNGARRHKRTPKQRAITAQLVLTNFQNLVAPLPRHLKDVASKPLGKSPQSSFVAEIVDCLSSRKAEESF